MALPVAAVVPVKPAWYSKINWLQVIAAIATLVATNAFGLDETTQVKVLAITNILQSVATIVLKTWFNASVTPSSLPKDAP